MAEDLYLRYAKGVTSAGDALGPPSDAGVMARDQYSQLR